MLHFPRPPKPRQPVTPEGLGLYLDAPNSGPEEWRWGMTLALWGVPNVTAQASQAWNFASADWAKHPELAFLARAYDFARQGHCREILEMLATEPSGTGHRGEAAEVWLEDFSPPKGSVLEKLSRRFRDEDVPPSFLALLAAQAATFQLSLFVTLLSYTYWEWRCGQDKFSTQPCENQSEFIDNSEQSLTLLLEKYPQLPEQLARFSLCHVPSQFHTR